MNGIARWNQQPIFDTTANTNTHPDEYLENGNGEQRGAVFGQTAGFGQESSTLQGRYMGAGAPTFTRDNSRSLGRHHDTDAQARGAHTSGNGYDTQAGTAAGHSLHQMLSRTTEGMRTWNSSSNDMDALGRGVGSVALNDGSVAPSSATGGFSTYINATSSRPFEFNPVTKEWDNNGPQTNGDDGHFQHSQGGVPDRGFSTGGPYPVGRAGLKMSVATNQPVQNPAFDPATPNAMRLPGTNARGRGQQFARQHLAQTFAPCQQYYDSRYSLTPQPFNLQYNPALSLALPLNMQYQQTYPHLTYHAGQQTRSGRGYDSADATRSPLLKEFRMSHKTHKRYELRVGAVLTPGLDSIRD